MYLALWLRLFGATGTAVVNVEVRAGPPGSRPTPQRPRRTRSIASSLHSCVRMIR